MSAIAYHDAITKVLDDIRRTQIGKIQQAGEAIELAIASPACWILAIWVRRMPSRTFVIASW